MFGSRNWAWWTNFSCVIQFRKFHENTFRGSRVVLWTHLLPDFQDNKTSDFSGGATVVRANMCSRVFAFVITVRDKQMGALSVPLVASSSKVIAKALLTTSRRTTGFHCALATAHLWVHDFRLQRKHNSSKFCSSRGVRTVSENISFSRYPSSSATLIFPDHWIRTAQETHSPWGFTARHVF